MIFEWDENKNRENVGKHGIDFLDAVRAFSGLMLVRPDVRLDYGEDRWIGTGFLKNLVIVVVFADRGDEVLRIITARKADKNERFEFEQEIRNRLGES